MAATINTLIFFAIVGGAAMAMIAVAEYYERKKNR